VKDEKVGNLDSTRDNPGMYVSYEQSPVYSQSLVVRGAMDVRNMQQAITAAIHQLDKDQAISDVKTLEQIKTESMANNKLNSIMLAGFATVALLLSAVGIYGVISYSVVQRTQEIGIRSALGASTRNVLTLILRSGMLLTVTGLLIGIAGSLALTHMLSALLFGVTARDPITMATTTVVLAAVALVASYVPARRAARVDPMICLRYE
jgi:putative ABC transport system permease protein